MADPALHRHKNLKGLWVTGVADGPHTHPPQLTEAEVLWVRAAAAAQGAAGGGTGGNPPPPPPPPPPPVPPVNPNITTVSSILALKQAIANDAWDKAILAAGSYALADPSALLSNSLWIGTARGSNGADMTHRTHTIEVDATAATFTGAGIKFMEGARFIDWNGLKFRSQSIGAEGIVKIGGDPGYAPAHDLVLRGIDIDSSCVGTASTSQAIYFAHALGRGPYNIQIVSPRLDLAGGLYGAVQAYHSAAGAPGADHITILDAIVANATIDVLIWDPTLHDWYIQMAATGTKKNRLSYNWNIHGGEQAPAGAYPNPVNMDIDRYVTQTSPAGSYEGDYIPSRTGLV